MAARLPALVAAIACVAAGAAAQTLDLKLKPVTEGSVAAFLTVDESKTTLSAPPPRTPGSPSDLSPGPPVGAVAALPLGKGSDKTWRFGAAGTPEMQPYLSRTAEEVLVIMDDGERRSFRPRDPARFRLGQRVTVRSGELEPVAASN